MIERESIEKESIEKAYKYITGFVGNPYSEPGISFEEIRWGQLITDGIALSGRVMTDEQGNTEVVHLSISNMEGEPIFDSVIKPYVLKRQGKCLNSQQYDLELCMEYGRAPHEVYYELKEILRRAKYVVTYDEMLECVLQDWGDICDVELKDEKMRRISGWFARVYGEMKLDRRAYKEQSLYTCARTLGYNKYQELNLGDTMCECQALAYCYKIKVELEKI